MTIITGVTFSRTGAVNNPLEYPKVIATSSRYIGGISDETKFDQLIEQTEVSGGGESWS